MFSRRARAIWDLFLHHSRILLNHNGKFYSYSTGTGFAEFPRKLKKFERKPWVTNVNELKRKARLEKQQRILVEEVTLNPPENGLLVKSLVPVAHRVLSARAQLLACASRIADSIPIHYCRLGRAVSHNERLQVDRIPAIVELCIQAGVDIPEYPTRRREFPIYCVAGRLLDFEKRFQKHDSSGKDISISGFWETPIKSFGADKLLDLHSYDFKGFFPQI